MMKNMPRVHFLGHAIYVGFICLCHNECRASCHFCASRNSKVRACECKRGAEPSKADWDVGNLFRCFVNDIYKGPQIKLFFSPVTTHHQDGSHSPDEALRDCLSPPRLCRLVIFLHFTG
eukprot:XP_014631830.1 uncharacterized protein LOC100783368 [Glycine max]